MTSSHLDVPSIVAVAYLLRERSFWGPIWQKIWTEDQVFKLRAGYYGRVGIYAASGEVESFVNMVTVAKGGTKKKAATFWGDGFGVKSGHKTLVLWVLDQYVRD